MSSTKLRLKQFKPTIKGLWKRFQEPLFFEILQLSYEVHKAHCTVAATSKNSRNFRNISAFSFKKASIHSESECWDASFWGDEAKPLERK